MKSSEQVTSTFLTENRQHIFYRNWKVKKPRAIMVIVHGLNSHSGYYQRFAAQLNAEDFSVFALDLRGRGKSEGERYYIHYYSEVLDDIGELVEIAALANPSLPIFLFGHSAGGVFASAYAVLNQGKLNGLICESIAFQLPAPALALVAMNVLSHIVPHIQFVKLDNAQFSRDKAHVERMNNDMLVANEKQPARTMQQLLLASAYLKNSMTEIRLPILVMHGTADKATKYQGSEYLVKHISSGDKELKLYQGYYHDLLNDIGNDKVIKDVLRWLNARI